MSELVRILLASKLEADYCVSTVLLPLILGSLRAGVCLFKVWCSISMFP